MLGFDFSETAGKGQSSSKPVLKGNEIHTVKFLGCEARDIQGVKDPTATFKVLDIKFSNDSGYFTHTIWEPREDDFKDREVNGIKNPSNVKAMMLLFKHLIDATNPTLAKAIDNKEKQIAAKSWDDLRKVMVKATEAGKDSELQIKLFKNKKGEAMFPYFASYNKAGEIYMSTNFIGTNLGFTPKEQANIAKMEAATPTKPAATDGLALSSENDSETPSADLDFNL